MSNPTELPDLSTVVAFLLGEGQLDGFYFGDSDTARPRKRYWWRDHLRAALARRAQPESEAPQAEASGLPLDVEFKQLADTILQATTNGTRLDALRSMAALFDKSAAQHAESGKEPEVRVYQYFDWGRDAYHNATESEWLSFKAEDRHIGLATIAKPEHVQEGRESNG